MTTLLIIFAVIIAVIFVLKELTTEKGEKQDKPKTFQQLLYKQKKFLTGSELTFFNQLEKEYSSTYYVVPQVLVSSIIEVDLPKNYFAYKGYRSRIDKKSVDFVLFDKVTFIPVVAIELDGPSHNELKQQVTDNFKDELFAKVGIKLLRIKVASTYDLSNIISTA